MPARIDWKAAVWASVIAGSVFMMLEMGLVAMTGESPWGPPRMIAAIAMGKDVLPPPATFDLGIMIVAMIVHFALSIFLGAILGWLLARWSLGLAAALLVGAVFGLLVYAVSFYGWTAVFPWFAMARNWITILSHAMFGLVLAWVYHARAHRHVAAGAEVR